MSTLLIKNASVISDSEIQENCSVICRDGKFEGVFQNAAGLNIEADEVVDASGRYLAPGFIDMHIHGTRNLLVDAGREQLENMCRVLPEYGVTGFLPSVCPFTSLEEDLKHIASLSQSRPEGTAILGFFLEGHFLSLTGAIANLNKDRSREAAEKLINAARPYNVVFGVSPEIEEAESIIKYMVMNGCKVFMTHTSANAEQTENAIRSGASHATHFYDVFPYPGEREPGVRGCGTVEAIMASPEVSVDFILDGEHVDPVAVRMALACKGCEKVCLITDASSNAGLPPGRYLGVGNIYIDVSYEGGPARGSAGSKYPGLLCGSGLTMDKAVRNAVRLLNVSLPQAVKMASTNPARVLGLEGRKGYIKPGWDADMVLLDSSLEVMKCWVMGKMCFSR